MWIKPSSSAAARPGNTLQKAQTPALSAGCFLCGTSKPLPPGEGFDLLFRNVFSLPRRSSGVQLMHENDYLHGRPHAKSPVQKVAAEPLPWARLSQSLHLVVCMQTCGQVQT